MNLFYKQFSSSFFVLSICVVFVWFQELHRKFCLCVDLFTNYGRDYEYRACNSVRIRTKWERYSYLLSYKILKIGVKNIYVMLLLVDKSMHLESKKNRADDDDTMKMIASFICCCCSSGENTKQISILYLGTVWTESKTQKEAVFNSLNNYKYIFE